VRGELEDTRSARTRDTVRIGEEPVHGRPNGDARPLTARVFAPVTAEERVDEGTFELAKRFNLQREDDGKEKTEGSKEKRKQTS
jgi:hypothetical protein